MYTLAYCSSVSWSYIFVKDRDLQIEEETEIEHSKRRWEILFPTFWSSVHQFLIQFKYSKQFKFATSEW